MERIIDLHTHTTCSDGDLTPFEVIDEAKKNGVSVLSITDHDCVMAYTPEVFAYAEKNGVQLVTGVEISTRYNGSSIHVLGYDFKVDNAELQETLARLRNTRRDYLVAVSQKLENLGFEIDVKKLLEIPSVTKALIAQNIVSNPANFDLLHMHYGYIPSKGEFIETMMNKGCPAYVAKFSISPLEASEMIHNALGVVVLAHPVAYKFENNIDTEMVLKIASEMNADGIEANYLYVDKFGNEVNEIEHWKAFSEDNDYFYTIGSDFHSFGELRPTIGFANKDIKFSKEDVETALSEFSME